MLQLWTLVLLSTFSCILSQEIVYDKFIDLCYGSRPSRPQTRCEGVAEIKVEKRLYDDTVPYWCISLDNRNGQYRTMTIEYNGLRTSRAQDNYYARELKSSKTNQDRFILQNELVALVVYPKDKRFELQTILSLKLDNIETCDQTRHNDETYPNQPNTNRFKYLNHCFTIKSKDIRPKGSCEQLDEVTVQEFEYNRGLNFWCITVNKRLRKSGQWTEDEELVIEFSDTNAEVTWSSKSNRQLFKTENLFKWEFLREQMTIAVFPKNSNRQLSEINSIKINNIESCSFTRTRIILQECGQRKRTQLTLSSFGLPTYPGQFPWHAGIHLVQGGSWKYQCGGSILNERTILTAAHCIYLGSTEGSPDAFRVHVGQHDLNEVEGIQSIRVLELIPHESYSQNKSRNDIALIKLRNRIIYNDYVQPICLPSRATDFGQKFGFVAGWGVNEKNEYQYILNTIAMPIVTDTECENSDAFFESLLRGRTFCAGFRNGSAVTIGDSGGGLVFDFEDGWYIKGIVSLGKGISMGGNLVVDISKFSLFTDVQSYIDWITPNLN